MHTGFIRPFFAAALTRLHGLFACSMGTRGSGDAISSSLSLARATFSARDRSSPKPIPFATKYPTPSRFFDGKNGLPATVLPLASFFSRFGATREEERRATKETERKEAKERTKKITENKEERDPLSPPKK